MIDLQQYRKEISEQYESNARTRTFNAIVYGEMGTGKTQLITTCPGPVLVHSFDPGGMITVRDEIASGHIIADTRFENDTPKAPFVYQLWEKEFERLKREKIFEQVGTFVLDSATTWAQAIMNEILRRSGRPGTFPQQNDYGPQMQCIENAIQEFTSLPCNTMLICHPDTDKDEIQGRLFAYPMLTGKLKRRIPVKYDECYVSITKNSAQGTNYFLLTQPDGIYTARTRLGRKGTFEKFEEPNIRNLLKKAGLPYEDKK